MPRLARRPVSRVVAVSLAGWLGIACARGETGRDDVALETCPSPRPQACTRDYRPACGHRCAAPPCEPAERRTYGNACDACADPAVRAVQPGACEGGPPGGPVPLR